tara:strand:- start:940 stop:1338 length:399 start_codon:yes stop_codon:yes gene_type:complete
MNNTSFYNTVSDSGDVLQHHRNAAKQQEKEIEKVFREYGKGYYLAQYQLRQRLPMPIASCSRAFRNLTIQNILEKTERTTLGPEGRRVHLWKLTPSKNKQCNNHHFDIVTGKCRVCNTTPANAYQKKEVEKQ